MFPRCKVTAFREPVVVSQLRIGLLCPALWRRINLVGKNTHGRGNLDTLRSEEGKLALPIETGGRDRRVRQPIECDVVENVVSRQAFGLAVENMCDEHLAAGVMVEHPGGQTDR